MDMLDLIRAAQDDGVTIETDGDVLTIKAPKSKSHWQQKLSVRKQEVIAALLGHADPPPLSWPEPSELPDELPPVMPYSSDLLPPEIGAAVDDIAERMQCPPDYPAASMLVAMAAVVGCQLGIRPRRYDDWLVVPNLWGCVVGRPSLKKTPATKAAEKELRLLESRDEDRLRDELNEASVDELLLPERINSMRSEIKKAIKNNDEATARSIAEDIQRLSEMTPPIPRRIVTTQTTIEKLIEMLSRHPAGMILFVDELLGWMRRLDRDDNAGVRQDYLTLWNGIGWINSDTISRGENAARNGCVSVFGCCTPGGLSEYVAAAVRGGRGDDGLVQRLQITVWPDQTIDYQLIDRWPDSEAKEQLRTTFERLADIDPSAIGQTDPDNDDGIPYVRFDSDGQRLFDEWDIRHQRRLRQGDLPEAFESHLSKYASMVPSIALLLHLASGKKGAVSGEATKAAICWAAYLETHARRLYSVAIAPERQHAGPLLRRLIDWPEDQPIRASVIAKRGWSGLTSTEKVDETLKLLEDAGWVRSEKVKPSTGRPTTDWHVHPEALKFLQMLENKTAETPKTSTEGTFWGFDGSASGGTPENGKLQEMFI